MTSSASSPSRSPGATPRTLKSRPSRRSVSTTPSLPTRRAGRTSRRSPSTTASSASSTARRSPTIRRPQARRRPRRSRRSPTSRWSARSGCRARTRPSVRARAGHVHRERQLRRRGTFRPDCATIQYLTEPKACGDEDFVPLIPPTQFLSEYVFFTDPTYSTTTSTSYAPKRTVRSTT